jgi:hypothetical protein
MTVTNRKASASLNSKQGASGLKRIATGLIFVVSAATSFAACPATTPGAQEMKDSDAVIIGTVESSRLVPQTWDTLDGTEYVVHVDQKVKGKESGEIKIFDERTEDSVHLTSNVQYLFFLTNNNSRWMINKCGNSGPMDETSPNIKQIVHAGKD